MDDGFKVTSCSQCGQRIEFPESGPYSVVACPTCGGETVLCEEIPTNAIQNEEITAGELQAALASVVQRPRVSVLYQLSLLLVAAFMIVLPVLYVALVVAAAYGVYRYAVIGLFLFSNFHGGIYVLIVKVILYIGPLLGGVIAVFFMLKPFLARSAKETEPLELNPSQHPRLFQFVAHLSDMLRVKMPTRIFLNCDVNASVGFLRGFLSILGNDLVLNLGLGLVGGLNTRQLAVLLAHELGHCTQSFAMRLGYIINRINRWFYRVVYQRDAWDEALEEWSDSIEDWRLSLVVACVNFSVGASRRILWMLMWIGHGVSCWMSRQMEYHADACAMAVAGSDGVESLLLRSRELSIIEMNSYIRLREVWEKRQRLPDSLPDFLEQLEMRLPTDFQENARLTLLNETAGLWATHPTAAQRIQQARRRGISGVFEMEKPARVLFRDFVSTAKAVSLRHYGQNLRIRVTNQMLEPVSTFFQETTPQPTPETSEERPSETSTLKLRARSN